MDKVDDEKLIGALILESLIPACPYAIIAGGAPRDWYLGETCNDIDVYLTLPGDTIGANKRVLRACFGVNVDPLCDYSSPLYKTMVGIRRIWEFEYYGKKVQLIQMRDASALFGVVENFSVSLCKVWFKDGKIKLHKDFKRTMETGIMSLSKGYKWTDPHPSKIKRKFKGRFTCDE